MTTRKPTAPNVKATEEVVFGYRAPSGGRRMMANGEDKEEDGPDMITDIDDDVNESGLIVLTVKDLRLMIKEQLS